MGPDETPKPSIEEAERADRQRQKMGHFFGSLDRQQRREMTRAAFKVIGKKETIVEMMARVAKKQI